MSWNAKRPEVPVDKDGNWLHYPNYGHKGWTQVWPFYDELKINKLNTGRSAKWITLEDDNGKTYPMFVSDLIKGIQDSTMAVVGGKLIGWWTASKRGVNYGIKSVEPPSAR